MFRKFFRPPVTTAVLEACQYPKLTEKGVPLLVEPGHFYSPIIDPLSVKTHLDRLEAKGIEVSIPGLPINRERMRSTWESLVPYFRTMPFNDHGALNLRYKYDNENYCRGDASVLYAMLRMHRPKNVIEIGSGWSSACMIDTAEMQRDAPCAFTFIEPNPGLLEELLGATEVEACVIKSPVQEVTLEVFDILKSGDFLFIDSTHVLKTGSDVAFELFEILPRLPTGVLVHFHDIFWPFEYPREWAEKRSWNELYALRAYLTQNENWEVIIFNDYLAQLERPMIERDYAPFLDNSGGALWLRRTDK